MNKQEKDIIIKYANNQIRKYFLDKLDKLKEVINTGSIDYIKCKYCAEVIKNWREAMDMIQNIKDDFEGEQK